MLKVVVAFLLVLALGTVAVADDGEGAEACPAPTQGMPITE